MVVSSHPAADGTWLPGDRGGDGHVEAAGKRQSDDGDFGTQTPEKWDKKFVLSKKSEKLLILNRNRSKNEPNEPKNEAEKLLKTLEAGKNKPENKPCHVVENTRSSKNEAEKNRRKFSPPIRGFCPVLPHPASVNPDATTDS